MNSKESDLLKLFTIWSREKHDAMISIIGFADLLLDNKVGDLSDQQQRFIRNIRDAATKTSQGLRSNKDYLKFFYQQEEIYWKWEAVNLSHVLENILSSNYLYSNRINTSVEISSQIPSVKADAQWLRVALINLIEPSADFFYREGFPTTIKALILDSSSVRVQIQSSLLLEPEHTSIASIAYPGSCLDLVSHILQEHDSVLELFPVSYSEDTFALFEFTLPSWKGR